MKTREFAIIVAGGKGTRIKSAVPKQFLELDGKPVLMHTIQAFQDYSPETGIVVVLPADDLKLWSDLCAKHQFKANINVVTGGESRFRSVKNGLEQVPDDCLVAIHDGVRPLVSSDIIGASYRLAAVHGSAVAAVRLKESIRMTDQDNTKAMDRSRFRLIQTPQTFNAGMIKKAYLVKEQPSMTDDASVAEYSGHIISLFEGSYENLKITTPEDLVVAQALFTSRRKG
ncbi:MAG: 2-C-methyl-D-erythritol 4-phosphate cytidylyltransferase [Bacteroidetes bacterium]|nr:2-C-methyl-D-erythritol 4-phosphate cytidylyltransferase [Bacteroidota bacterium]